MKVILKTDVYGLGDEGDIIDIANGYARNYLIPSEKVMEHSTQNLSVLKSRLQAIQKRKKEKRVLQMSIKEQLEGKQFDIVIKTNDKGHLYGAVNQSMVAEALAKENIEIDKRHLMVPEHTIKEVGSYELSARLSSEVQPSFTITVISENHPDIGMAKDEDNEANKNEVEIKARVTEEDMNEGEAKTEDSNSLETNNTVQIPEGEVKAKDEITADDENNS